VGTTTGISNNIPAGIIGVISLLINGAIMGLIINTLASNYYPELNELDKGKSSAGEE
jgi:hypothetical protein